jgi:hypothetical protein
VLLGCPGRADELAPRFVTMACTRLFKDGATTGSALSVLLVSVVANALVYNPVLAVQVRDHVAGGGRRMPSVVY